MNNEILNDIIGISDSKKVKDLTVGELKQIIKQTISDELFKINYNSTERFVTPTYKLPQTEPYHTGVQIYCENSNINKQ